MHYLYLKEREHVETWLNGGQVPLNMASNYKSKERNATSTPDEVTHLHLSRIYDEEKFLEIFGINDMYSDVNISIRPTSVTFDGKLIGENSIFEQFFEDALIFCLATKKSKSLCDRLEKKYCVEILDIETLKKVLDTQLESQGVKKKCQYTHKRGRNHFLKSSEDKWQMELRIVWSEIKNNQWVTIPAGLCKEVELT
jgi:hypothetical protein